MTTTSAAVETAEERAPRQPRDRRRRNPDSALPCRSRVCMGAMGGLLPIVVTLAVTDVVTIQQVINNGFAGTGSVASFAGWAVKVLMLMTIGGLVAYFYESETSRLKLLQIGIAAPAILTSMVNGANVAAKPVDVGEWRPAPAQYAAIARPGEVGPAIVFQRKEKPSPFDCFVRGLIDRKC
ncbi:MAG: hypothetical protein AB7K86_11250 [Rhodospirillales bacterium]